MPAREAARGARSGGEGVSPAPDRRCGLELGMKSDSGNTVSLWLATAEMPEAPRLAADATADVCVVGAGIAGLSVAYELALAGLSVIVIDRARIGDGMTGR